MKPGDYYNVELESGKGNLFPVVVCVTEVNEDGTFFGSIEGIYEFHHKTAFSE